MELERSILQSWQIYFTGCDCCPSTKFFAKQETAKTALFVRLFVCSGMIFFDRHKKRKTALLIQLIHYCFLK